MAHKRQNIRDSIVTELQGVAGLAGVNIYKTRAIPLYDNLLPAILVYTFAEEIGDPVSNVRVVKNLTVIIEIVVQEDSSTNVDEKLDDLSEIVEGTLNSFTPTCAIQEMDFQNLRIDVSAEGEKTKGSLALNYNVKYANNR